MIVQAVYSGRYSGGEIERERDYRFTHAQWILITLWKERLTYALTLFKLKIKRNVFLVWTICLYSISSCAYLNLNQDLKTCKISETGEVSIDVASTMARYQLIHFPWEWIIIYVEKTTNMKLWDIEDKFQRGSFFLHFKNVQEGLTHCSRHLPPLKFWDNFFRRSSPSRILSTILRPRLHRLPLFTVLLFLQHLCQWTDHLPHIAVPVACVYSSSSACPASTAPASSSSLRSANLTDWGRLWPNTLPHLSLSSVTHLALSAAFTGLLRLTASPPVTCELPPNASISNYKSHFMTIFHCWTFLINKSYDNDNVYLWISLTESLLVMSPEAENILEELSWLPSWYFPVLL